MLSAKELMTFAYAAYRKGATDEAANLTMLAMQSSDIEAFFVQGLNDFGLNQAKSKKKPAEDEEGDAVSPVVEVEEEQEQQNGEEEEEKEFDPNAEEEDLEEQSLTDMLKHGDTGKSNAGGGGAAHPGAAAPDNGGLPQASVYALYEHVTALAGEIEAAGYTDLASEIMSCLE